jgi:hypothetical protein
MRSPPQARRTNGASFRSAPVLASKCTGEIAGRTRCLWNQLGLQSYPIIPPAWAIPSRHQHHRVLVHTVHALKCVVARGLTAVNMKNFPGDEFCSVEVHHRVNDIRDFSHSPHWMQRCQSLMGLDRMHRGFDNA